MRALPWTLRGSETFGFPYIFLRDYGPVESSLVSLLETAICANNSTPGWTDLHVESWIPPVDFPFLGVNSYAYLGPAYCRSLAKIHLDRHIFMSERRFLFQRTSSPRVGNWVFRFSTRHRSTLRGESSALVQSFALQLRAQSLV